MDKKILLQVEDNEDTLQYVTNELSTIELLGLIKYLDIIQKELLHSLDEDN